jgi:hypothetical protein
MGVGGEKSGCSESTSTTMRFLLKLIRVPSHRSHQDSSSFRVFPALAGLFVLYQSQKSTILRTIVFPINLAR